MDPVTELHQVLDQLEDVDGDSHASIDTAHRLRRRALDLIDRLPTDTPGQDPDRASPRDQAVARASDVFIGLYARLGLADLP